MVGMRPPIIKNYVVSKWKEDDLMWEHLNFNFNRNQCKFHHMIIILSKNNNQHLKQLFEIKFWNWQQFFVIGFKRATMIFLCNIQQSTCNKIHWINGFYLMQMINPQQNSLNKWFLFNSNDRFNKNTFLIYVSNIRF